MFWFIVLSPLILCVLGAVVYIQMERLRIHETWKRYPHQPDFGEFKINEEAFFRE